MTVEQYIIAALVVILIGLSKAGFAGGTGLLATPLFCLVVSPRQAVAVLLPILCACDWASLFYYRRTFSMRPLLLALPGAVVGIAIAAFLLGSVDESMMKIIVGAIAVLFVTDRVVRRLLGLKMEEWKPSPPMGTLLGAGAGFFSTLAHAAGPVMAAYLLPQKLSRQFYVGTTVVFFTIVNHLKLIPYAALGLLDGSNLWLSLTLLPVVPVGVWLGVKLNRRMNEKVFLAIVYTLLFLTGLKLLGVPMPLDILVEHTGERPIPTQ